MISAMTGNPPYVSGEKLAQEILCYLEIVSQLTYLNQQDEKTRSAKCFIEVHIVNMIKELNFNCCSSHPLCIIPNCYNFH